MADIHRYQPRRSSSSGSAGRRFIFILAAIAVVLIMIVALRARGHRAPTNNTNQGSGIELRNDNVNQSTNVHDANTNVETNTNADANTNSSDETVSAPDTTNIDLSLCTSAISQFGTGKRMALTFNLAAANQQATDLVNELVKDKIPASFFVAGTFAQKNPDFIKSLAKKGFGVYNRSNDNPNFSTLTAEQVTDQLTKADDTISGLTNTSSRPFFRPPFGATSDTSVKAAHDAGYCTVLWTVDALDWQDSATAEGASSRVVSKAKAGAIVMFSAGYDVTTAAVKGTATDLRKAGYSLVSLVELLES